MNKAILLTSATIFGIAGGYLPFFWGDTNLLGGWSILTGTIGGIVGIVVAIFILRRID